jgi:hypothetical protein
MGANAKSPLTRATTISIWKERVIEAQAVHCPAWTVTRCKEVNRLPPHVRRRHRQRYITGMMGLVMNLEKYNCLTAISAAVAPGMPSNMLPTETDSLTFRAPSTPLNTARMTETPSFT